MSMTSQPQQPINPEVSPSAPELSIGAMLYQPASFWIASLASLAVIIGAVGPWATYLNYVSISGTSMHGWREAAVGAIGLAMLGLYQMRGWRPTLLVAWVFAVLGLIGAIDALHDITSGGALTVFGITYRYLGAAWGIYLVVAGTIVMTLSVASLTWRAFRSPSRAA
jgi:hypothetical protein